MKIVKNRTFRTKVSVELPTEAGFETVSFVGVFKALTQEELEAAAFGTNAEQRAFISQVLIGWDGVTDDQDGSDKPYPFSPENRDLLLQDIFIMRAVNLAYAAALSGAKRGN